MGGKIQCSFCNSNHLVVNCWKKNEYPPHIKARIAKANTALVSGSEEALDQDFIDQDYYKGSQTDSYGSFVLLSQQLSLRPLGRPTKLKNGKKP